MSMVFHPSSQILAFAALQAYVEQGLRALPMPPRKVYVDLHNTDAVNQICFHANGLWIGVSYFRSPVPLQAHDRAASFFTMVHRDKDHQAQGSEVTSEPKHYEFHGDFIPSGVAQVGDAIIELLRPEH